MTDIDRARILAHRIIMEQVPRADDYSAFELTTALFIAACESLISLEGRHFKHLKENVLEQRGDVEMGLRAMLNAKEALRDLVITKDISRN